MKKIYLSLILVFSFNLIFSQPRFQKYVPSATGFFLSTAELSNGYVAAGYINLGSDDPIIVLTDASGTMQNSLVWATPEIDDFMHVTPTSDGGAAVTGFAISSGFLSSNIILARINPSGFPQWTKAIGDGVKFASAAKVAELPGGNLVVAGTLPSDSGDIDVLLLKISQTGTLLSQKTFSTRSLGLLNDEQVNDLIYTSDNSLAIMGNISNTAGSNIFIIKTDTSFNSLWTKTYNDTLSWVGYKLTDKTGGDMMICGRREEPSNNNHAMAFAGMLDNTGSFQWLNGYTLAQDTGVGAMSLCAVSPTSTIITGYNSIGLFTFGINPNGQVNWATNYSSQIGATSNQVIATSDGGLLQSGSLSSGTILLAPYLMKTTNAGIPLCGDSSITVLSSTLSLNGISQMPDSGTSSLTAASWGLASGTASGWSDICTGSVISELPASLNLKVYPNPSHGEITIELDGRYESVLVKLTNLNGQIISQNKFEGIETIKLKPDVSPGIYFASVLTSSGKTGTVMVSIE